MAAKWPWIERTFTFDFPVGKWPDVLERYRGAPARVDEKLLACPLACARWREARGGWTILENIGHLVELEALWEGRLDDYLAGAPVLRAADMRNRATRDAGYNDRDAAELAGAFRAARRRLVARLGTLAEHEWSRVARHPRLNVPMRLVDAVAFSCEHDDYHLARVTELTALWEARG
ncbi:MAG: DinB family protein [Phycisphaerae bacterium]|nr:DinB family protein [Phycisphaerae bacterium]